MIALPEIKVLKRWKQNDYLILGSQGFWDLQKYQSKLVIETLNKHYFTEALIQEKARTGKTKYELKDWEQSPDCLKDVLLLYIKDYIGKNIPEKGVLPTLQTGYKEHGYQNISAIMIKFN